MNKDSSIRIRLPQQNLAQFTHFRLDGEAASDWAQQLPVANTRAVAAQLQSALDDLNHSEMAPELRYTILEALSDNVQVTLANLTKRFLHQPLVMPEEPKQLAELTENLYTQLINAYALLAVQIVNDPERIREQTPPGCFARRLNQVSDTPGAVSCSVSSYTGRSGSAVG